MANLNSPVPKTLSYMQKCLLVLYRSKICVIFCIFFSKFGCHGNFFSSSKIGILQFTDPENPPIHRKNSPFLHRAEISVILADFYLNLVVMMATPFAL